jgi:hypothetical protein
MTTQSHDLDDITLVPTPSERILNPRQQVDYREHRRQLLEWAVHLGKDPAKANGYAFEAVKTRSYRIDKFYRFVWSELTDGYTLQVSTDHADEWMKELAVDDE